MTGVVGVKWKPSGNFELGSGYEFPLTERTDILQQPRVCRRDLPLLNSVCGENAGAMKRLTEILSE